MHIIYSIEWVLLYLLLILTIQLNRPFSSSQTKSRDSLLQFSGHF